MTYEFGGKNAITVAKEQGYASARTTAILYVCPELESFVFTLSGAVHYQR